MKKEEVEAAAHVILGRDNLQAEFEDGTWTVHDPATGACWDVITNENNITSFECIGEGMKED